MGKELTVVRSLQRKLVPDTVGSDKYKPTTLKGTAKFERTTAASAIEEPGAGKPHAGIRAGGGAR